MRHFCLTCDAPDLPGNAFAKALGRNRPATLEGGKGSSAPSYPDPTVVAGAQTASNDTTAAYNKSLNLNNYSNAFGSQQSTQTGTDPTTGAPIYSTTDSANPQLQSQLNGLFGQTANSGAINSGALSGLTSLGGQYGSINQGLGGLASTLSPAMAQQAQQQGQQAAYASSMGYLQPQFNQQQESTSAQLANQGLAPGSEAWNNAETNLSQNQGMQQQQALNNAELTGSQIGSQNLQNQESGISTQAALYGQQAGNLGAQAGLYGQQVGIGQTPYSNLSSIAQLIPGYSGVGNAGANSTDVSSLYNNQYQSQLAGYNANQASSNATMGALGTIGGMAAMAFL